MSAPVRDHSGDVVAGLTISGPEQRFTPKAVERFARIVVQAADALSLQLGAPATKAAGVRTGARGSPRATTGGREDLP